ncbi:peptidoglycan DD-metalloendopeptidase family protein [Labilibaculum sp. DW002]|uniref:Peptidoglycan DD-metalloendopeptidase family protein n=1 Tax=Paralabilibaculum antarcticum TaxID=2912572 RepID=A0ABT5VWU2_9BACT|nr:MULTISPECIES: peptidoglycan DD-metalloendopeptidase family protein [unclassified Labilibaculum]MBI9056661.1 peptidoglycan DD-metalloendopeptidase family protein [Labilibaculum sp.]MDE5419891.1 peptidoglycan DD-metalloendopeptidase family protein [Labilibaculum sp. DW002]
MGNNRLIISKIYYIVFVLLLFISVDMHAQTSISTLKKRKEQNAKDIAYTNTLLKNTLKTKSVSLGQLNLLNQRIKARQALLKSIENEISYMGSQIDKTNKEVKTLESELLKLKDQYAKVILYAYKQKNSYEKLMFLLSSKDFNQAYKRYKYLQQFSEYSRKQGKTIALKRESLEVKLNSLNLAKKEKLVLLSEKTKENNSLTQEKSQQAAIVSKLKKKEKQLRNDLRKQQQYSKKLEKEIQRIIARAAKLASKKKTGTGKFGLTPEEKVLSASFDKNKGKLPWPTKTGFISEKFGEHKHAVLKHVNVRNDGVNITTDAKSECRSIFKGEVTHILSMPGLNNVIIIRHGEFFSVYSNLSSVVVKKGDTVTAKEKIGVVYTDQAQSQTVLKFQLWKGSTKLNPSLWLYRN